MKLLHSSRNYKSQIQCSCIVYCNQYNANPPRGHKYVYIQYDISLFTMEACVGIGIGI